MLYSNTDFKILTTTLNIVEFCKYF